MRSRRRSLSLFTLLGLATFRLGVGCSDSEPLSAIPQVDAAKPDVGKTDPGDASDAASTVGLPKTIAASNAATWVGTGNTDPKRTKVGADSTVTYDGASTGKIETLESDAGAPDGGAAKAPSAASIATDSWSVAEYRGHRIRMTGYVKTENATSGATLWLRFDSGKMPLLLANGLTPKDASIKGTHDFAPFVHVVDVPETATGRAIFGAILIGTGTMWVGGVTFEEVGTDVPVTPSVADF